MRRGELTPHKTYQAQKPTRRWLQRELKISIETLYKWEWEVHSNLKKLPHSFQIWKYLVVQSGTKKHPRLDDYQIECLFLLAELRRSATANTTVAETVKDNEFMFYELHEQNSPLHNQEESNV